MALKGNENTAISAVHAYLTKLGVSSEWEPGEDPPDTILRISGGQVWAAEITGLHQHFSFQGKQPQSAPAMIEPLRKMLRRIRARTAGKLKMSYVLKAFPPNSIPLVEIERQILAHIESGVAGKWTLDAASILELETKQTTPYRVALVSGLHAGVRTPDGLAGGANIAATTEFAIDKALESKLPRMSLLRNYSRKLLVLVGEYRLASPDTVSRILQKKDLDPVDAVLYVEWDASVTVVADPSGVFEDLL
jgi:hypothetical protein